MLVVAYYTRNTPYEKEAEVLKVSLEALGYEYDFLAIDDQGSWQKNTQYKAHAIKQLLIKHAPRPILYLDVDAIMIQKPIVLDDLPADVDIAAVHYNGSTELLSGTIYMRQTALPVVERWIELNRLYPEYLPDGRKAWDQRTLRLAILETKANFYELPQEYTWIVELTQKSHPGLAPVILHTRGSLRFGQE